MASASRAGALHVGDAMKKYVTCPESGHLEELEIAEDPEDGHILGVTRCTAFAPEEAVDCDELCIRRLNARDDRLYGIRCGCRGEPEDDD